MACFLVPGTEAVILTAVGQVLKSRENVPKVKHISIDSQSGETEKIEEKHTAFSRKFKWLTNMLWGGAFLLAFEHVWHGEVVPWFPFLTAAGNPADKAAMLHEMSTIGVTMAVLVTAAWAGMLIVSGIIEKKKPALGEAAN